MMKKVLYFVIVLSVCGSAAAQEPLRQRSGPEPVQLPAEISAALDDMYARINAGDALTAQEAAQIQTLVMDNRRYLNRFDDESRVKYLLLSAWTSYFLGNDEEALRWVMMARNTDADDSDVRATLASIAILAGRPQMANVLQAPSRTAAPRPRPRADEGYSYEEPVSAPASTGRLEFDLADLHLPAMGKKTTVFEGSDYRCINGAIFTPARGTNLFALIWKLTGDAPRPAATGYHEEREGDSRAEQDEQAAFKSIFLDYFGSDRVQFVGINTDPEPARFAVMASLAQRAQPWMQTMSEISGNRRLADLAELAPDDDAALAVIARDGTVQYMGRASGFLPKLLAAKVTDNYVVPDAYVAPGEQPGRRIGDPNRPGSGPGRPGRDPNSPVPPAGAATEPRPNLSGESTGDQADDELAAERLYNVARQYLRNPALPTAGQGVNVCRQILRQYPNTEHAEKARELLRELPENVKQRHRITPEEQGL